MRYRTLPEEGGKGVRGSSCKMLRGRAKIKGQLSPKCLEVSDCPSSCEIRYIAAVCNLAWLWLLSKYVEEEVVY